MFSSTGEFQILYIIMSINYMVGKLDSETYSSIVPQVCCQPLGFQVHLGQIGGAQQCNHCTYANTIFTCLRGDSSGNMSVHHSNLFLVGRSSGSDVVLTFLSKLIILLNPCLYGAQYSSFVFVLACLLKHLWRNYFLSVGCLVT